MSRAVSFLTDSQSYIGPQIQMHNIATVGYVQRSLEGRVQTPVRLLSVVSGGIAGILDVLTQRFTVNSVGLLYIDGVPVLSKDRVVLAAQVEESQNGIYEVVFVGDAVSPAILERAEGFNRSNQIVDGTFVWVSSGNSFANTLLVVSVEDPFKLNEDPIFFIPQTGVGESVLPENNAVKLQKTFSLLNFADDIDANGSLDLIVVHGLGDAYPMVQFYSLKLKAFVDFFVQYDYDFGVIGLDYLNTEAFVVSCDSSIIAMSEKFGEILMILTAVKM